MPRLRFGLVVAFAACLHLIAVTQVEAACTGNPSSTCNSTQCCYEDIPVVLGIGGDIVPDQSCYDTSIDYVCNGDLAGPPFNNCVGGAWTFGVGPTCTADVQCPQPTVPTYGAISPDQTEYEKYTTITYSCNSGFTLTGPQQSTCESDGTWNPTTTPTCDANCNPPTISNGEISPNKSSYVNGEVINYSCDTNYTLVGITSTTCRDGAFDPSSVPNCYGKCNPPVVANSNYDTQQGLVEHSSTIEIICDTQYSTGTGTETDLRCTDGNFDDNDPVCYANCPVLEPFDNGNVNGDTTPYYHEETVTFSCAEGYTLVGSASISCYDGDWSDDQPKCYENCQLSGVRNSNLTSSYELSHNGWIVITCDSGYSNGIGTSTEVTCDDGVKSPSSIPACYANCPALDQFNNGNVTGDKTPYYHEETVTFSCAEGYTLVGSASISCYDGEWSDNQPVCYANCQLNGVPNSNSPLSSELLHNGSIVITCNSGYSNGNGTSTEVTCNDGVKSPSSIPSCFANCQLSGVPNSNFNSSYELPHSGSIIITCDSGYSNGNGTRTEVTCNDGAQSPSSVPECYENCQLSGVPNSNLTSSSELPHNGSIVVTCDSGFSTGNGISTNVTCNDGAQSPSSVPECYADCLAPFIPNSDYSTDQSAPVHLQKFNVTCDEGYSNRDKTYFTQTCNNGTVSGGDPTCYQDCPEFSIEDGSILGDTPPYWHEENVTITCETNFTLVGVKTLECSDGNWSDPYPSCESDCLPPVIPNSNYSSQLQQVTHGTSVVIGCDECYSTGSTTTQTITCTDSVFLPTPQMCYSDCSPLIVANSNYQTQQPDVMHSSEFNVTCNANYSVDSCIQTRELTCTDGELSENVTCYADCSDPGTPEDGSREYVGDRFCHGTTVIYQCDTRFDLNGAESIECQNGEWSDAMPNCTATALYDLIMLTCGPSSMEVEIPKELLKDIGPTDLGLEGDLSCAAYLDGDLMKLNTSLTGCGTNKTENGTYDTYHNRVVNNYYDDTITRVVDVQIPMTCSYPRNQKVRALRYVIDDYIIGKNLEETGTYKMTFGIYSSGNYGDEDLFADGQAIDIPIDNQLYFRLELVTDVADNSLVVQNCWATPSEDDSSQNTHQLVHERCPVDETFRYSTSNSNGGKTVDFELSSFRFVMDDDKEVYVHCEVFVCHSDSKESMCNTSCSTAASRRRRDIDDDQPSLIARSLDLETGDERMKRASMHDPIVKYVKAGPIQWQNEGNNKPVVHAQVQDGAVFDEAGQAPPIGTKDQSANAMMHSVIGLGVVIAFFSIVLLVVVRHYRKRLQKEYRYHHLQTYG